MKTKTEQVEEWMKTKPVIRDIINGKLVETTGEDRRSRFENAYDDSLSMILAAEATNEAELARKVWPNSAAFLGEFTMTELSHISLSTDQTIAALRLLILSWADEVWSDDPRIVDGLAALVDSQIITNDRLEAIVCK